MIQQQQVAEYALHLELRLRPHPDFPFHLLVVFSAKEGIKIQDARMAMLTFAHGHVAFVQGKL